MSVNKKIIETEAAVPEPLFTVYSNQSNATVGGTLNNIGFQPDFSIHSSVTRASHNVDTFNSSLDSPTSLKLLRIGTGAASSVLGYDYFSTNGGSFNVASGITSFNNGGEQNIHLFFKANGGTTSSNSDGSITSTVQVNSDAGFSIIRWTGTGSNGTIGTGLSTAADLIITKAIGTVSPGVGEAWPVFHSSLTNNNIGYLDRDYAASTGNKTSVYQDPTTTSTTFKVGNWRGINQNGLDMISYAFHSVEGFSSFGSYTGNGSSTGPTVTTGFEPKFIMIKRTDAASDWRIFDAARDSSNPRTNSITTNLFTAQSTTNGSVDFNSTSFQIKSSSSQVNASGGTYIYWVIGGDDANAINCVPNFSN